MTESPKSPKKVCITLVAKREIVVDVSDLSGSDVETALNVARLRAWRNLNQALGDVHVPDLFQVDDCEVVDDSVPANVNRDGAV